MTPQEKLELIREKCIAANPRREEGWDWDSGRPEGSGYMDHAPCRLADVLLAIKESESYGHYIPSVDCEGYFRAETGVVIGDEKGDMRWNLYADDLEKQSEETISFLYELLK